MNPKVLLKSSILFILFILFTSTISGQVKQVLYVNQTGVDPGNSGSPPDNDAIISMLNADENFEVTYVETPQDGSAIPDVSNYDLVIAQESIISGAVLLQPGGKLGIKDITVPIIYCKSSAFRDGRAVTDADAVAVGTQNLFLTVPQTNQNHDLFSGIDFSGGNDIRITFNLTNNSGSDPGAKAIDIINNLDISTSGTLLGTVSEVTDPEKAIVVNYLPAGTQLGEATTDKLNVDAITLSFGYGPLVYQNGSNISNEALTIWRNAAYLLTGLEVPDQLYYNPALTKKILYINQNGMVPGEGAATPGYDPVLRMLEFEEYFEVTYVETASSGSQIPDLSQFDLIVAQQTLDAQGELFKPNGKLGIKNVSIPIIYNNMAAFTNGNAITDGNAVASSTQNLAISVSRAAQRHDIFSGIDFSGGNNVQVLYATAGNDGSMEGDQALDLVNNVNFSGGGVLLASLPEVTNASEALVVNYLPSGTQLGESTADVLSVNAVVLPFNYGVIASKKGANLTNEGLTLWRNAAYMLTDLPVPSDLCSSPALTKQVLYLNQKGVDPGNTGGSEPGDDPITRMLTSDPNFKITYVETYSGGQQIPDPQLYDLVIAQETLSSGSSFFKPGGKLSLSSIKAPIIYNKTSIFRDGRAVSENDVTLHDTQNLNLTVLPEQQQNDLFSGINFKGGEDIRIFKTTASSDGLPNGGKAMEIVNNLDISETGTLLASVSEVTNANQGVVVNYFPSGTQLGTAITGKLQVNAFAFSFSYGALISGDGANVSSEGLTMWRNAAYILTGLEVPVFLYVNGDFVLNTENIVAVSTILSCSPNPATNLVEVNIEGIHLNATLSLCTLSGKLLWKSKITSTQNTSTTIDVSDFESGMYILKLQSSNTQSTLKLMKR